MNLQQKFAANLKKVRTARRLSQDQLARKASCSVALISMLERGNRSPPLARLESIAIALGTSPQRLLS
jgi:transcriptional regulator with XRE-family HTH domain